MMVSLFYKKRTSVLIVAAIMVLIFLLCILLVMLTQLASLNQSAKEIKAIVESTELTLEEKREELEYRGTDKYVIEWAIGMGYIEEDENYYVPKN